jgi:hypothetical protein
MRDRGPVELLDRTPEALAGIEGLTAGQSRHDDGKLLAAEPRGQIGDPTVRAQNQTDLAQNCIAGRVTKPVIDQLEQVNVGDGERQGFAGRSGVIVGASDVPLQSETVGQPGQRIGEGQLLEHFDSRAQDRIFVLEVRGALVNLGELAALEQCHLIILSDWRIYNDPGRTFGFCYSFHICTWDLLPESV